MTVQTMRNFKLSPPLLNLLLFRLSDLTATNGPLCKEKEILQARFKAAFRVLLPSRITDNQPIKGLIFFVLDSQSRILTFVACSSIKIKYTLDYYNRNKYCRHYTLADRNGKQHSVWNKITIKNKHNIYYLHQGIPSIMIGFSFVFHSFISLEKLD